MVLNRKFVVFSVSKKNIKILSFLGYCGSGIWFSKFSSFNWPYVLTNVIRFLVQATEKPFTFSTLTGAKFTKVLKTHLTSKLMKWTIHSDLAFYSVRVCFNFNILMMGINGSLWIELTAWRIQISMIYLCAAL